MNAIRQTLQGKNVYFLEAVSLLGAMWGMAIIIISWVIH